MYRTATGAGPERPCIAAVTEVARRLLPAEGVITDRARLRTYECDGLAHYRVTPALVVIPEDARAARRRRTCVRRAPGAVRGARAPAPACPAERCRTPRAS